MTTVAGCICICVATCCSEEEEGEEAEEEFGPLLHEIPPIFILTGEGASGFPPLHYYLRLQPGYPQTPPFLPLLFHRLCNKYSIPTVSGSWRRGKERVSWGGGRKEDGAWKKNRIMHFFIKNSLSSSTSRFSPLSHLKDGQQCGHTVNTYLPYETLRQWTGGDRDGEKRSLVLFMIPGLVAIWVPLFMSTPRYGPHMRGGLSVSSESNSASALHPLASRAGGAGRRAVGRFWRREEARPPLSRLWGTLYFASGVCQCD